MMHVSRETWDELDVYAAMIRKWNARINLVAPSSVPHLQERHIADSLQLVELSQPDAGLWADLGSGGGFPGLVAAIACRDRMTDFILVESDQRKSAFLRSVIRELGLKRAEVISARIEDLNSLKAAYISIRALAPLPRLMPYLVQHLEKNGQAWLMKGRQWQAELDETASHWRFSVESHPSKTDQSAAILKIWGLGHV